MLAARVYDRNDFRVEEVPVPAIGEEELLLREGKNVRGIVFNLEMNYYGREEKSESEGGVILLPPVEEE